MPSVQEGRAQKGSDITGAFQVTSWTHRDCCDSPLPLDKSQESLAGIRMDCALETEGPVPSPSLSCQVPHRGVNSRSQGGRRDSVKIISFWGHQSLCQPKVTKDTRSPQKQEGLKYDRNSFWNFLELKATWRHQMVSAPQIPPRTGSSQSLLADHHILMDWETARAILTVRSEGTSMPFEPSVGI